MSVYEMSDEERNVTMLAMAGFELDKEERASIRPLYLRMLHDRDPSALRREVVELRPAVYDEPRPTMPKTAECGKHGCMNVKHPRCCELVGLCPCDECKIATGRLLKTSLDPASTFVSMNDQYVRLFQRETLFRQIDFERTRQDRQWGGEHHDNAHARRDWIGFIEDHAERAKKALPAKSQDLDEYRKQLVEIAALAVAAIESHDRVTALTR